MCWNIELRIESEAVLTKNKEKAGVSKNCILVALTGLIKHHSRFP
jgi:hypothetical protein